MVADEFNKAKTRINCIDFEDMLIFTADLLRKETIRKNVTGKFKYIMIDEYQDTNDLQFAIFLPILGDLSAGNLYVVGDKKQSIYGFRDADLNVFNKTAKKIADNSGSSVILEHTFRLSKELTAFVNQIFPSIFSTYNPLFDGSQEQFINKRLLTSAVDYEDTTFFDINKTYKNSEISFLINREKSKKQSLDDGDINEDKSSLSPVEKEAKLLVSHLESHFQEICEINNHGGQRLSVAILTRKRKDFVFLESALAEANIPYELMGGKRFYQHQVVQDISLIFQFISDPEDDFLLYSLLRSPFFSFSDEDLLILSQAPGTTVFSKLGILASDEGDRFLKALNLLIHLKSISLEAKPFAIIDFMLSKTPYLSVIQNRPNGKQYLANIRKIQSQAIEFESSPFNSVFDYNDYLAGLIAIEEDETQAPLALDENSVKIMTIHQSKGLEFTTVYLFAAGDSAFSTATQSENTLSVSKDLGLIFKVPETEDIFYKSKESLHFRFAGFWRKQIEIEEAKRVLYVAITRAANNLFICGTVKDGKHRKNSFLEMVFQSLNLELIPEDDLSIQITNMKIAKNENGAVVENVAEDFNLDISFISEFDTKEKTSDSKQRSKLQIDFQIHPESIPKHYSDEIITASKFITFLECPFKYYLNYISGVANISNFAKLIPTDQPTSTDEEYLVEDTSLAIAEGNDASSKRSSYGAVTGSIIHDYLAKMDSNHFSEKLLKELVENYFTINMDIGIDKKNLIKTITYKLENYLASGPAEQIENFATSHNEFEIFLRYGSFYLMGVIDKIIILEDRIIIIDYKTGKNLEDVMERYLAQLNFYAFLTSRIYPNINTFELRLISIDNYDESVTRIITRNSVFETEEKLNTFVDTLRSTVSNSGFSRNTGHCHKCKFSIHNNRCFVP
ncbi:MAG: UvrD-helicase domain-containing protein [Ignavibacteriales bacterium]|nr:UvrD-helicase domain-containing protein [Ignavibacteriales bacterium]